MKIKRISGHIFYNNNNNFSNNFAHSIVFCVDILGKIEYFSSICDHVHTAHVKTEISQIFGC